MADYDFNYISVSSEASADKPVAIDIFDPGCSVCMISYRNQKAAGFFDNYDVHMVPFAIQDADDSYKFKNSEIVVRYMFAAEQLQSGLAIKILDHLFTEKDEDGVSYQTLLNEYYSETDTKYLIEWWLKEEGFDKKGLEEIRKIAYYPETTTKMSENREIIENQLKIKGIPTTLYDGKKHTGLWKVAD